MTTLIQLSMVIFFMFVAKWKKDNDYLSIVTAVVLVFIGLAWLDDYLIFALCLLALSPYYIIRVIVRAIRRSAT